MAKKRRKAGTRVETVAARLAVRHRGRFAAIDPRTGRFFLGDDEVDVILRARSTMPKTVFEIKRLGFTFAHSIRVFVG